MCLNIRFDDVIGENSKYWILIVVLMKLMYFFVINFKMIFFYWEMSSGEDLYYN